MISIDCIMNTLEHPKIRLLFSYTPCTNIITVKFDNEQDLSRKVNSYLHMLHSMLGIIVHLMYGLFYSFWNLNIITPNPYQLQCFQGVLQGFEKGSDC